MSASPPIPLPAAAGVISGLLTFVISNSQGVSAGTGLPLSVIIGIVVYYFTFVVTQQPNLQTNTNENQKPKKKTKQDKKKQTQSSSSSSSSAASDDEEVTSNKKKDKKSKKAAAAAAAIAAQEEENDNESEASTSEADGDNDDDDGSSLSKNAKKKAKKKAKELAAKKEEEKKAAAAAAAASAKKGTANKKEEKKQQSAPVSVPVPAPAASGKKDKKAANKENVSVSPAPVALSPPAQEEDFQQSKSDKKKNKKDEKKKREEEAKLTQPKVSETPKTPTPISPAIPVAVKESKKHESKSQLHAAPISSLSPPPTTSETEEGEWNVAKAARPTSAQKQANKAAESKSSLESSSNSSSISSISEPADYVDIPVSKVAAIIGTKGTILKALQEGTHATIEVPKAAERDLQSLTARILIRGDPEAVKYAKICVKSLAEKGYSPVTHPGFSSDDVYVESKLHGMIIGPKGSTLKNIQAKTGTMIRMPERGGNDRLIIVGPKEGVKSAKEAIKSLVADGFSSLTHEGQEKKEIEFPSAKFGILIGPSGQTIRSIQGNTKTQIKIPATGAPNQNVIVIGPPAGVIQAEKEIRRLLEPKTPKKPEDGKDENNAEEAIPSSEENNTENPTTEAPQSAFDAWNAAEAQPANEDALWAADQ